MLPSGFSHIFKDIIPLFFVPEQQNNNFYFCYTPKYFSKTLTPQKMPRVSNTGHCLFMLVADYLRALYIKLTLILSMRASISVKTFSTAAASVVSSLPSETNVGICKFAK